MVTYGKTCAAQASPSDPENFPFVVLGNKIDMEGGKSRMVQPCPLHLSLPFCNARRTRAVDHQ